MGSAAEEVLTLVGRISGSKRVGRDSRLLQDLSIAGDDADQLLREVQARFEISLSGFLFSKYFPDEHEALGDHIGRKLRLKRNDKAPVTVGHLIAVVEQGSWFDPPGA